MLNVVLQITEKPDYYHRTYFLPEMLHLLRHVHRVEGARREDFQDIEDCNVAPGLLANALFDIPPVLSVRMEQRLFSVHLRPGSNGPEIDAKITAAFKHVVIATLGVSISYLNLRAPTFVDSM